jgi:putative methionine-R-sulfoxide reductase with GAF domain
MTVVIISIYKTVSKEIREMNEFSKEIENGKFELLEKKSQFPMFTEIYGHLQTHLKEVKRKYEFTENLIRLNFDVSFTNVEKADTLAQSLEKLRNTLKEKELADMKSSEEKSIQDRHISGLAEFGGLLRRNTEKPEVMAYELVSGLVKFMNCEMCGLYLLSSDQVLVLMAAYAYNERKYFEKTFALGEGLPGACAAERTSFYFDHLTDDYIRIISGFGNVKPNSLLLIPILLNNEVYGVIEIASLREFSQADRKFLENLGADIASTLLFMKVRGLSSSEMKEKAASFLKMENRV